MTLIKNTFFKNHKQNSYLLILIIITQVVLASSELIILKSVSIEGFNLDNKSAILFVISLSLIGYFYCLDGGYLAVFRTDIIQFIFIVLMGVLIFIGTFAYCDLSINLKSFIGHKANLWFNLEGIAVIANIFLNLACSFAMGFAFIIASPDTWKRVYIVTTHSKRNSMWLLFVSGLVPFVLISPLVFMTNQNPEMLFPPLNILISIFKPNGVVFMSVLMIGIIATFMSSFDSALILASHLTIINNSESKKQPYMGINGYYKVIGFALLIINGIFAFIATVGVTNPYYLANLLLIGYATSAGLLIGVISHNRLIKQSNLLILMLSAIAAWTIYLSNIKGIIMKPGIAQIKTIPVGVAIGLLVTIISFLASGRRP